MKPKEKKLLIQILEKMISIIISTEKGTLTDFEQLGELMSLFEIEEN